MAGKKDTAKAVRREKPKAGNINSKPTAKTKIEPARTPAFRAGADLLERISDGFVAFDAQMNYIYVNARAGELLGRKPADLVGKNFWKEFPEAKGTPFANAYARALGTQKPIVLEDYYAPFDRWFENRIYPSPEGLAIFFIEIAERKQAERNLRAAEIKYRTLVEQIPPIVYVAEPGQHIGVSYVSPRIGILGFSQEEWVADPGLWLRQIHPDDQAKVLEDIERIMGVDKPAVLEYRIRARDGAVRWFLDEVMNVVDSEGKILSRQGFMLDITERKQAEEELQESEKRFSTVFFTNPVSQSILSQITGLVVEVNDACCNLYGYSRAELLGTDPGKLDLWANPAEQPPILDELQRTGRVLSTEVMIRKKSGEIRNVLFTVEPISWKDIPCLLTSSIDITERKRAEEQIRYQANLLAHVNDAILASDENFVLTSWNHSAERIYGWKAEDVIGKSGADILQTEFLTISRTEAIKQLIESGEYFAEVINRRKDGARIFIETRTTALRDPNGKTIGYVSINRDITERKRAEEELRLSRDRLAKLSRQLVQTHETESRAIGRELHDQIGQMLTALKLTLEIAPQLPSETAAQKYAQAHDLVGDLMNSVSRLSLELRPPMLDDFGLIPALLWQINRYQEHTNIAMDFKHSGVDGKRFVSEIETTVYRIVQESLTNVARHAQATSVRLGIHIRGEWMEIQIEDDGAGFDVESALAQNRGLGGMHERVGLLNGTFRVQSEPGRGARIFITLPLKETA